MCFTVFGGNVMHYLVAICFDVFSLPMPPAIQTNGQTYTCMYIVQLGKEVEIEMEPNLL